LKDDAFEAVRILLAQDPLILKNSIPPNSWQEEWKIDSFSEIIFCRNIYGVQRAEADVYYQVRRVYADGRDAEERLITRRLVLARIH
jgi:hypothetical protein